MFKGSKDLNAVLTLTAKSPATIPFFSDFFRASQIKKKKAATAEADDLLKDMLGDMGGDAAPKRGARPQEVANEMIDFTNFDTSNYDSNKRRRGGFDAFDAPPPSATMMDFDADGDVSVKEEPQLTEEEQKIQDEIEALERQERIATLKKKLEAKQNGEVKSFPCFSGLVTRS